MLQVEELFISSPLQGTLLSINSPIIIIMFDVVSILIVISLSLNLKSERATPKWCSEFASYLGILFADMAHQM